MLYAFEIAKATQEWMVGWINRSISPINQ